jgi:hypothetical protein
MEENKLIAEFMGFQQTNLGWYDAEETLINVESDNTFDTLKYDTDWNWLMAVVDKIERIEDGKYDVNILKNGTQIIDYTAGGIEICNNVGKIGYNEKIEHTYQAVIKFIKWYEQNSN